MEIIIEGRKQLITESANLSLFIFKTLRTADLAKKDFCMVAVYFIKSSVFL